MQEKEQFYGQLPQIDCGACGSPTCATFAEDVVKGDVPSDDCVFLAMSDFEAISATLLEKVRPHSRTNRGQRERNRQ